MKQRVLITGASGFVGFHLIEAALAANLQVIAAVRRRSQVDHLKGLSIEFSYADFSNQEIAKADLQRNHYDYIIHAAGVVKARTQANYDETNAALTQTLAHAALGQPQLKKFVFMSSLAALGPSRSTQPITEQKLPQPVTQYGKSKLLAEQYVAACEGLPYIIIRPTAVYGPRERELFVLIKTLAAGFEPYIGRNDQLLSFIYVKDLAAITVRSLFTEVKAAAYNITDGQVYNRYQFAENVKAILKRKTLRAHVPMPVIRALAAIQETAGVLSGRAPMLNQDKLAELTASNWSCDITKAMEELSFAPAYNLKAGLAETLQWYKDNQWLK